MCVNLVIPHLLIVLTDVTLEDVMHKNVKVKRGGKKKGRASLENCCAMPLRILCLRFSGSSPSCSRLKAWQFFKAVGYVALTSAWLLLAKFFTRSRCQGAIPHGSMYNLARFQLQEKVKWTFPGLFCAVTMPINPNRFRHSQHKCKSSFLKKDHERNNNTNKVKIGFKKKFSI